jgi:hypothetical protein
MVLTANSDVYSALDEDGINLVVEHVRVKRPSLFNYGTEFVVRAGDDLLCEGIEAAPEVRERGNPLITEVDPLPVIGTDDLLALDYCFQLAGFAVDFAPGSDIDFPDGSGLGLGDQQLGVFVRVCAGLGCPSEEEEERLRRLLRQRRAEEERDDRDERDNRGEREPIVPHPRRLLCFCLDAYLVGRVRMGPPGVHTPTFVIEQSPEFLIDEIAIADPEGDTLRMPEGMTASIECYLRLVVEYGMLPKVADAVEEVVPKLIEATEDLFDLAGATLTVSTPTSGAIPNNPAIEDDQFKLYMDVAVSGVGP